MSARQQPSSRVIGAALPAPIAGAVAGGAAAVFVAGFIATVVADRHALAKGSGR